MPLGQGSPCSWFPVYKFRLNSGLTIEARAWFKLEKYKPCPIFTFIFRTSFENFNLIASLCFFKIVVYDEIKTIDELHGAILFHVAAVAAVVVGAVAAVAVVVIVVVVVAARVLFMATNYQISSKSQKRRRKLCFLAKDLKVVRLVCCSFC